MKIYKKNIIVCLAIAIITVISKLFQFYVLPPKYFYDSKHILSLMNEARDSDKAYSFTAAFYKKINFLHLDNIYELSITITVLATIILIFYLLVNGSKYSKRQYIFIFTSIVLLDIYAFNLSKEVIQLLFFLIACLISRSEKIKTKKQKIVICSVIFLLESILFRVYYAILAIMLPVIYCIININRDIKIYKKIILIAIIFFAIIFIGGTIYPDSLKSILNARSSVNDYRTNSVDANTIIIELFGKNENYLVFCLNYIVDFIRLLLPVELLFMGIKYIPFVIYQFMTVRILVMSFYCQGKDVKIFQSLILSFLCISAIFEPDFGSFVRHQTCIFPVYLNLLLEIHINSMSKNNTEIINVGVLK